MIDILQMIAHFLGSDGVFIGSVKTYSGGQRRWATGPVCTSWLSPISHVWWLNTFARCYITTPPCPVPHSSGKSVL